MRQRVVIAMALVMSPALVIADEPTTALDVTIQAQILELLAGLQQRVGMSMLLITHDLGVVAETCSRVIVMYGGEVVEEASVTDLFSAAHHPYTEGLLGAMPRVGQEKERLDTIPGTVPPPTAWPSGCRFRDRCRYSWERCAVEHPPLYTIGAAHVSRCHLAEEPQRRAHPHEPLVEQIAGTGGVAGAAGGGRRAEEMHPAGRKAGQ
jgi:oligopeptide/dipeptide ABC transporter ATP-binding protein